MLDCALVYRRAYERLQLVDKDFKTCPTQDKWRRIEVIKELLEPFYVITTLFSGSKYPTSNMYFHNVWKIQRRIQEEMTNSDPLIREMAFEMKAKFDKYWENYSMILSFAIILDPRYKVKIVEYCFDKLGIEDMDLKEKVDNVVNGLKRLYKEYEISSNVVHGSTLGRSSKDGKGDDLDGFDTYQSRFSEPENEKSQLEQYLADPLVDRNSDIDILHYWRGNQERYPHLALMARDILSIPITTVASESSFSIGGQIISKENPQKTPKNPPKNLTL
ncbi:zinc finger BED domain-containing protein DAYSLEEPER-like [Rutidosis leptorrhynchoides]|uniref:zinc finger BED domain-containing protein DAYSLEEPER-like n=1 Tax=Rutidosis leptorrhynchoides TaxID=125765 RepID=UPI003A98D6C6